MFSFIRTFQIFFQNNCIRCTLTSNRRVPVALFLSNIWWVYHLSLQFSFVFPWWLIMIHLLAICSVFLLPIFYQVVGILYIFWTSVLCQKVDLQNFSPSLWLAYFFFFSRLTEIKLTFTHNVSLRCTTCWLNRYLHTLRNDHRARQCCRHVTQSPLHFHGKTIRTWDPLS